MIIAAIMLKVDYTLSVSLPPDVDASKLSASKTHKFPVHGDKDSHKNYYDGLRAALATARNTVGDELTKWKELVGKAEEWKQNGKEEGEEPEEDEQVCWFNQELGSLLIGSSEIAARVLYYMRVYQLALFLSLPRGRSRTTILLLFFGPLGPGLRVRVPLVPQPQIDTGCLFDLDLPRPPPWGWSFLRHRCLNMRNK